MSYRSYSYDRRTREWVGPLGRVHLACSMHDDASFDPTVGQPVEVSYDGSRYLSMRPVGSTDDSEGFAMSRGNFPKMIVLINELKYDRAQAKGKPLDAPMSIDDIHRIWIGKFSDLEISFDGVEHVNVRSVKDSPPGADWRSDVYSFNREEMYAILSLFSPPPYED